MIRLARYSHAGAPVAVGHVVNDQLVPLRREVRLQRLSDILESSNPYAEAQRLIDPAVEPLSLARVTLLPPIDQQEVWAAGVTYRRSKAARMEESESAATLYDRVYTAERPELFFKATPHRVAGSGQSLQIRADATWNVPEPELVLVLNSRLELVGFTIGNDMSSRDIEGENPLYLPQAKIFDGCCGLGPGITLFETSPAAADFGIELDVCRDGDVVFRGATNAGQMVRSFSELIGWLGRYNSFPNGAFLMTGTGIVPDSDFTLRAGDVVEIRIDNLGVLSNPIVQSESPA